MNLAGLNWMLVAVIGVIILAVVIAWAMMRNRAPDPQVERSEEATRRLYEEEEREHHGESDNMP